jgi:transcriptional regulator GlxA family with amidase domain
MHSKRTRPAQASCAGAAWSVLAQVGADAAAGSPVRGEPVRAAQDYLRTHLDVTVEVAALARRLGLSSFRLCRTFGGG